MTNSPFDDIAPDQWLGGTELDQLLGDILDDRMSSPDDDRPHPDGA